MKPKSFVYSSNEYAGRGGDRIANLTGGKRLKPFISKKIEDATQIPIKIRLPNKTEADHPNWHKAHKDNQSVAEHVADHIAAFCGSWTFLGLHTAWFGVWIIFRVEAYPFGLLTMVVSLEAIFLSTIIMISQNRQGRRDRFHAEHDYAVNEASKSEIEQLIKTLDRIEIEKLDKLQTTLDNVLTKR